MSSAKASVTAPGAPAGAASAPLDSLLVLAEGGMGFVELVRRREGTFERLYARKRLLPHLRSDPAVRQMFLDEARLAGRIRHPNVVPVLDIGEDADGPFLLMEYVEGAPAAALIAESQERGANIPVQIAVRIALGALRGLHAAHELAGDEGEPLNLVHRDVSAQNLLVSFEGGVFLTDFGIAKALGNAARTRTGLIKGNVGYLSPEQLRFEPLDRRSDLFGLGVVLYELCAGRRLYDEPDVAEAARRVLREDPPDIGQLRTDVPDALVELLLELLAKDREQRPPSAAEAASRLEAILAALIAEEGPHDVGEYMRAHLGDRTQERKRLITQMSRAADERTATARKRAALRRAVTMGAPIAVALALAGWLALARRSDDRLAPVPGSARTIWAGGWHSCAVEEGKLYCWGKNHEGQLGRGDTVDGSTRGPALRLPRTVSAAAGPTHTCACTADGALFCWGRNSERQLGRDDERPSLAPELVAGVSDCLQVATGTAHTCVLRRGGTVVCFGDNGKGQLGAGGPEGGRTGRPVSVPVAPARAIAAAGEYSCALTNAGQVACFGDNSSGQLGVQKTRWRAAGEPIPGVSDVLEIGTGRLHACARHASGSVTCWGATGPAHSPAAPPTRIPALTDAVQIAVGMAHACALRRDGRIVCWGAGIQGQLGDGNVVPRGDGLRVVASALTFHSVAAGDVHSCADHDRGVSCWGWNETGQIGDGTSEMRPTPRSVAGFVR